MSEVLDLDILRPEPRILKLNGKQIDVSFVPCGITFEVDDIIQSLSKIGESDILEGGESSRTAYELGIKLCALYATVKNPEMNEAWFRNNTNPEQVGAMVQAIREALMISYRGVSEYQKKTEAARTTG